MNNHSLDVSDACKSSVVSSTGRPKAPRSTTSATAPNGPKLYQLVQQHAATFFAAVETATDARLPQFVKDEFDAFRECGILAHGSLRLHCGGPASLLIHPRPVPSQGRRRTVIRATGLRQSRSAALKLPMP